MRSGSDPNKAAMKAQKEQMKRLDALELPELEEYMLQNPELVGLLDAETIADSKMNEIELDPALRENQMKALDSLRQQSEEGLTATDKYAMEQMLGDVSAQERSQRASIESDMARKGMDSSGAALMAKLQGTQSGTNSARDKAMQMAAQGQQNRMQALQALGSQSGQMNQQDFARQAQQASAQDAIARANAMNRQNVSGQNLSARQAIENQRAGTANQQAQVGNQIAQQNFNNQVSKATGQGSVANSMSNIAGNAAQKPGGLQSALGGAATGAGVGAQVGGPVGAGYGAAIGAGAGLLSSFEDGGIAQKENLPIQYQREADMAEYKAAETKQHESFKKKYMKRIQDEVMGTADKPKTPVKPEGKTGHEGTHIKAQDGALMLTPEQMRAKAANSVPELQTTPEYAKNNVETLPEETSIDGDKLAAGLKGLSEVLGAGQQQPAKKIELGAFNMQAPQNAMTPMASQFEDGGAAFASDGTGEIVDTGTESYAGDRVDAKLNDKEIVVNVPQQQRLMDLLRGKISVDELGTDDIVEGVPREFRDEMHEELEEESNPKVEGIQALLEMLGK